MQTSRSSRAAATTGTSITRRRAADSCCCAQPERGWYQEWGKAPRSLKAGDVVEIPAEVKHWHGAKKDSWFAHIAVEVPGENTSNEWLEPVTGEEYGRL